MANGVAKFERSRIRYVLFLQVCGDVPAPRMYRVGDKLNRKCADFFLRRLLGINELAIVKHLFRLNMLAKLKRFLLRFDF